MNFVDYDQKKYESKKLAVLEVLPGWYLKQQGQNWPSWTSIGAESYLDENEGNNNDFTTREVTLTTNLAQAMNFQFQDENDRFYKWALEVSKNFPKSKFVSVEIKLGESNIFNS